MSERHRLGHKGNSKRNVQTVTVEKRYLLALVDEAEAIDALLDSFPALRQSTQLLESSLSRRSDDIDLLGEIVQSLRSETLTLDADSNVDAVPHDASDIDERLVAIAKWRQRRLIRALGLLL